jgi:hypothetical protein
MAGSVREGWVVRQNVRFQEHGDGMPRRRARDTRFNPARVTAYARGKKSVAVSRMQSESLRPRRACKFQLPHRRQALSWNILYSPWGRAECRW